MPWIRIGGYVWQPRLLMTVLALSGIALTLALGNWQLARARYKADLQARQTELARAPAVALSARSVDADSHLLRKVEARGRFEPKYTLFIDNRVLNHVPGYHVIVPLQLAGTDKFVLVNRGWIAAARDRTRPPEVAAPAGEVTIRGTAVAPSERYVELSPKVAEGNVWQNLVLERFRQATRLDVLPFVIQQEGGPDDGLAREWSPPDLGRNTHLAYAFQWFALSAAIFLYYLVTNVRRATGKD